MDSNASGSGPTPQDDTQSATSRFDRLLTAFERTQLEDWNAQRQDLLHHKRTWREDFERRIRERWGEAFDSYETFVEVALLMWTEFNKRWFYPSISANDHQTLSLIELTSRSIRVAQEVYALLTSGFGAGAQARARTSHELAVIAMFLRNNPPNVARRYREHAVVMRHKRAVEYNSTLGNPDAGFGFEPIDSDTVTALAGQRERLKKRYGDDFVKGDYGWAAMAMKNKRPTFRDLERSVNMGHLRSFYLWGSQDVHAGSHGNELSYAERASGTKILNSGQSNAGLADPAQSALVSLHQTTTALWFATEAEDDSEDSCPVEEVVAYRVAQINALGELLSSTQQAFVAAERQLEADEKQAWESKPSS